MVFPKGALSHFFNFVKNGRCERGEPLYPKKQRLKKLMAIYHFSVKNISRSDGRSIVAAAAYRSAEKLVCQTYDKEQDYTKKTGVEFKKIYAPSHTDEHLLDRQTLWNEVEKSELKKNGEIKATAQLAREFEIAFPKELNQAQRQKMLDELCQKIVERHGVIVDACIHAPHTASGSDERNYHAHILLTTRSINEHGTLGKKTREFNDHGKQQVEHWRAQFAELCNHHLEQMGSLERVDHRSYKVQGLELEATQHEGSKVTQLRRQGIDTEISLKNDAIKARNAEKLANEQLIKGLDQEILLSFQTLSDLERLERSKNVKDLSEHIQVPEEPKNALERKTAQNNPILEQLHAELAQAQSETTALGKEVSGIEQRLKDMDANKPQDKILGLFGNSEFYVWKEEYLKLESTLDSQKFKLEAAVNRIALTEQRIQREQRKPQVLKEQNKETLDFKAIYALLNQDQQRAYNTLKATLEQNFSGQTLERKLAQVQAKFIEKYKENPQFEVPQQELQKVKPQDFVRGASKNPDNENEKGR